MATVSGPSVEVENRTAAIAVSDRNPLWQSVLCAALLTALIAGPWLLPGYIFGTDFPGPRHFPLPSTPTSYAPLQLALALGAGVFSGEVVGKGLILVTLFVAGLTANRALPFGGLVPRAFASVVYVVNPFVYDRLAYGQLTVLAGFAVLPWVASSVRHLLMRPRFKRSLVTATAIVIISVLDVHFALLAVLVAGSLVIGHLFLEGRNRTYLVRLGLHVALVALIALVASAYWLIPVLRGVGPEANILNSIGGGDLTAFRTTSDPNWGLFPNILALYGFWAERTGRFASMKEFVMLWPLGLAFLLGLLAVGVAATLRNKAPNPDPSGRTWVVGLLSAGSIAVILAAGISEPHLAPLVHWLDAAFPPYRGMRDSGKWGAVIALAYAGLAPVGVAALLNWTKMRFRGGPHSESAIALVTAVALATALYYGNGVLYGLHGQISPSAYPAGWYAADALLASDPNPQQTLFLPWHGYLTLSFLKNSNHIVGSPAPTFFSVPIVASHDLEIPGVSPPNDVVQASISRLVVSGAQGRWAQELASMNVKYVLMARESDWENYLYLDQQPGLVLVGDYGSIRVYRNVLVT